MMVQQKYMQEYMEILGGGLIVASDLAGRSARLEMGFEEDLSTKQGIENAMVMAGSYARLGVLFDARMQRKVSLKVIADMFVDYWSGFDTGVTGVSYLSAQDLFDAPGNSEHSLIIVSTKEIIDLMVPSFHKYIRPWNEPADKKFYDSLPEDITLYRGGDASELENDEYGYSWTTDLETAKKFAGEMARYRREDPVVMTVDIKKKDLAFVVDARGEKEIMLFNAEAFIPKEYEGTV